MLISQRRGGDILSKNMTRQTLRLPTLCGSDDGWAIGGEWLPTTYRAYA